MQFKTTMLLLGAKSSKGDFNGNAYDFTTLFYQADLQEGDNFCGQVGEQIKWGTSANFAKIKDLKFPLTGEATMQQLSNGRTTTTVVLDFKPDAAKPADSLTKPADATKP